MFFISHFSFKILFLPRLEDWEKELYVILFLFLIEAYRFLLIYARAFMYFCCKVWVENLIGDVSSIDSESTIMYWVKFKGSIFLGDAWVDLIPLLNLLGSL